MSGMLKNAEGILAGLLLTLAASFRLLPDNFLLMLFKSFALQGMVLSGILGVFWLFKGKWVFSFASITATLLMYSLLPPLFASSEKSMEPSSMDDEDVIKVAHFNVDQDNRAFTKLMDRAEATGADLISFQEVDEEWARVIDTTLQVAYPYRKMVPQENNYGMALVSKFPFEGLRIARIDGYPMMIGSILKEGDTLAVASAHTKAPDSYPDYSLRNEQLAFLTEYMRKNNGPGLLIGDLNSVPWDDHLIQLRNKAGLKDGRRSLGLSFPTFLPPLMIPIDHILHSKELECLSLRTIGGTASDHRGMIGVFKFKTNGQEVPE